jgi:triphosphoribosyl-dephospho-CoA synthase
MQALASCLASRDQARAVRIAALVRQALIAEAELTPKPGLVDRRGAEAHTDLSLAVMRCSALAIEPYFCEMALIAAATHPSQVLRERLAVIGRGAEHAMLQATGGANSHKGAIWILGLLSAAAMRADHPAATTIAGTAGKIASFEDRARLGRVSHGDVVAAKYGVTGARGEAIRGFPHVVSVGLPVLHACRASGVSESVARLDTLLGIMSRLEDTCLLYRGGEVALRAAQRGASLVVKAGGSGTGMGRRRLQYLDRRLLDLNVSPGGSADLLAATLFLYAIEQGHSQIQTD